MANESISAPIWLLLWEEKRNLRTTAHIWTSSRVESWVWDCSVWYFGWTINWMNKRSQRNYKSEDLGFFFFFFILSFVPVTLVLNRWWLMFLFVIRTRKQEFKFHKYDFHKVWRSLWEFFEKCFGRFFGVGLWSLDPFTRQGLEMLRQLCFICNYGLTD